MSTPQERLSKTVSLHDDCMMPFGKYRGQKLGEVPDSYFTWFLSQDWCDQYPELVDYANLVSQEN